jgi:hypothetical protein
MMAKAGIVERVEVVIAGQRRCKHVSAAPDTDETIENAVFSMRQLLGNGAAKYHPGLKRREYEIQNTIFIHI